MTAGFLSIINVQHGNQQLGEIVRFFTPVFRVSMYPFVYLSLFLKANVILGFVGFVLDVLLYSIIVEFLIIGINYLRNRYKLI